MNLLACPNNALVHCLTFLTDFRDRNRLPAVSLSFERYSDAALDEAVAELFKTYEIEFSASLIGFGRNARQIEMRVERVLLSRGLDGKQTLLTSNPVGHIIYKWYEAQIRLHLFAGMYVRPSIPVGPRFAVPFIGACAGASAADIANICIRNMSRADLNLKDPRVLEVFARFLFAPPAQLKDPLMPRFFADLVELRDMGALDLGFSFLEVLQTVVRLGDHGAPRSHHDPIMVTTCGSGPRGGMV